jgi:hypothetical protein
MTTADPAPYDGQPFASIGALTAAERAWGRGLVARGWPELGWHVVGRDSAGHLVAVTVLPCGIDDPRRERHCYQTFTPAGLIYRSVTVAIAAETHDPTPSH